MEGRKGIIVITEDSYSNKIYLDKQNVTVETSYRLNFEADRTCGYTRVFTGKVLETEPDDEVYEIYMELHECGLTAEQVEDKERKIVEEIKSGKLDVTF